MGGLKGSLGQGLQFAIVNGSRPMAKIRGKAAFVTPEHARVREKSSVCKALAGCGIAAADRFRGQWMKRPKAVLR
jgi:hypothetical protein